MPFCLALVVGCGGGDDDDTAPRPDGSVDRRGDGGAGDTGRDTTSPPDGGRDEATPGECSVLNQTGCGPGEGCYPGEDEPTCETAGTTPTGQPCDAMNSCAPGNICAGSEGNFNCLRACRQGGGAPACTAPQACQPLQGETELGVCGGGAMACDILAQTGCTEGQACYLTAEGSECLPTGRTPIGSPCEGGPNACEPRGVCAGPPGGPNLCYQLCSTTGSPGCTAPQTCQPLGGAPEGTGVCAAAGG